MKPPRRSRGPWPFRSRAARRILRVAAALPLLQTITCFPDVLGALNFELQSFIVNTLVDAVSIVVANVLRL